MDDQNTPQSANDPPAPDVAFDSSRPPERSIRPPSNPGSEGGLGALIPTKNPFALAGYYCAVFSLIPCLGFILGPIAFVLGLLGLKAIRNDPRLPGKGHAHIGIWLGGLVFLAHIALTVLIVFNAKSSP